MKTTKTLLLFVLMLVSTALYSATATNQDDEEYIDGNSQTRYAVLTNLGMALISTGKAARIYFHGTCGRAGEFNMQFPSVKVHSPAKGKQGIESIRDMFSDDPKVVVSEDPSGVVRVRIGDVATRLLDTKVHLLEFSQLAQYNPIAPGGAVDTVERAPEVEQAVAKLKLYQLSDPMDEIEQKPLETAPHLTPSMEDVTVDQAFDAIATTFGGMIVYGECSRPNGESLFDIDYWWIPSKAVTLQQVQEAVAAVATMKDQALWMSDKGPYLDHLTKRIDPREIDDKTLESMESLLDSNNDLIRFWGANALGNLGPRAEQAIPKLRTLFRTADCLNGPITSADAIIYAFERIGVKPPPRTCPRISA
jgi:hypothetical protein